MIGKIYRNENSPIHEDLFLCVGATSFVAGKFLA
jgi:hypothetical protein